MKLLLLLAVLIALGLFAISLYNALVTARNAYRNAFAQIDVQLTISSPIWWRRCRAICSTRARRYRR